MKKLHKDRLLKVARALRESKHAEDFTMACYGHSCGTPACALGHYAARRDLQRALRLVVDDDGYDYIATSDGADVTFVEAGKEHFGLTEDEADELFGGNGCGLARTPKQAARYIERFVARAERRA